ncbi:MAG: hypothetical protein HY926_13390 [Elusimicrobia bacterium]|nr:hypothetical protein [Elusimicrobiota bacterium]
MMRSAVFCLLLALPVEAREFKTGPVSVDASGYLKELWQYSHSGLDGRPFFLNLDRARLTLEAKAAFFKAHADYDHEVYAGSYFRTSEYQAFGLAGPRTWLEMEQSISTSATSSWRHRLYRGWLGFENESTALRFGRQRVAWGTGKLWNPTDVLNPYRPAAVEREERAGVDALYLRQGLGELSQAELAYAPQDRWPDSALLARGRSNYRDYDFSAMGGKLAGSTASWIVGGDFAGNLWEGSLHGEWSYTDPETGRPYWRGLIGYEYTFSSEPRWKWLKDSQWLFEYYHNGRGTTNPDRYDRSVLLSGKDTALGKDYAGLTLSKDLHPLLKLEAVFLGNIDDGSALLSPSLQYNPVADLYLTGGWQRFGGGRRTEFGFQPNLSYLQLQYFF